MVHKQQSDQLDAADLERLADLQIAVLPASAISRFGRWYAWHFFRYAGTSQKEIVLVERNLCGSIVAAAVITMDTRTLEKRLALRTPLLLCMLPRVLELMSLIKGPGQPALSGPELLLLLTDQAEQRKGHATRLLERCKDCLKERGEAELFVRTFDDPADPALKFYRDRKFELVRRFEARNGRFTLLRQPLSS